MRRCVVRSVCGAWLAVVAASTAHASIVMRYEIVSPSSYAQGCYEPCACPIWSSEDVRGSFELRFVGSDPVFAHYAVRGFELIVLAGDRERRLSGAGTYDLGGEVAYLHRMELDLSTDGGPPEHFYSETAPAERAPEQIDIDLSIHGFFCFDTGLYVRAARRAVLADMNCDAAVDNGDIDAMVLALTDAEAYRRAFPDCRLENGDINGDGATDNGDIDGFVALLLDE